MASLQFSNFGIIIEGAETKTAGIGKRARDKRKTFGTQELVLLSSASPVKLVVKPRESWAQNSLQQRSCGGTNFPD